MDITVSGPIFDGRAVAAGADLTQAIVDRVAAFALEAVQKNLDGSLKNPTPYYETQIQVTNALTERRVDDRGVIYGPFLEGTSSRNQTTRFKGYASFRRAYQSTVQAVPGLAESEVRRHLGRFG